MKKCDKTYYICAEERIGREDVGGIARKYTNSPETAIRTWFRYSKIAPSETYISCLKREDAIALIKWASEHKDLVECFYNRFKCSYRLDWLLGQIDKEKENGCKDYFDTKFSKSDPYVTAAWGDAIHPFGIG